MIVCRLNFAESDFLQKERLKRRTLKPKVVPSKNLPKLPHEADSGPSSRIPRTRQIQTSTTNEASPNNNEASEMFFLCENDGNVKDVQDIETAEALLAFLNSQNTADVLPGPSYRDSAVQWSNMHNERNKPMSVEQKDILIEFKFSSNFTRLDSIIMWKDITNMLNATPGAKNEWKKWRKSCHDI
ncbi:hypothetical protein JTB14_015946 [Gonioctena quinquepunctata]|nr:hypothetical protein JTB14_015946 [Gonioctena quinquepunctata]